MGHSAKNQQIMNFKNTLYGFRDLIGRKFSDPYVQQEMKNLPFSIVGQKNDAIGIKVTESVMFYQYWFVEQLGNSLLAHLITSYLHSWY